jgi:hypothetical protein
MKLFSSNKTRYIKKDEFCRQKVSFFKLSLYRHNTTTTPSSLGIKTRRK